MTKASDSDSNITFRSLLTIDLNIGIISRQADETFSIALGSVIVGSRTVARHGDVGSEDDVAIRT